MAKQKGIHRLSGKVDGMSYYSSKNGGSLVRSINAGMSERVKTAKEYLNTRKNNAEFGMCGDLAGAIVKAITSRWRFILDSIATGKLVKVIKEAIVLDTTDNWGQRKVQTSSYATIQEAFNSLSKNEFPSTIAEGFKNLVNYNEGDGALTCVAGFKVTSELIAELQAIGATGFYLDAYRLGVDIPEFIAASDAYSKADTTLQKLYSFSKDIDSPTTTTDIIPAETSEVCDEFGQGDNSFMPQAFLLYRPYRKVGSDYAVLQQHCAAMVYVPEEVGA